MFLWIDIVRGVCISKWYQISPKMWPNEFMPQDQPNIIFEILDCIIRKYMVIPLLTYIPVIKTTGDIRQRSFKIV